MELEKEDHLQLLVAIKKPLIAHLRQFGIEVDHPRFRSRLPNGTGSLFLFFNTEPPTGEFVDDYAFIQEKGERLLVSISIWTYFNIAGDWRREESQKRVMDRLVALANHGIPSLQQEIEQDLPEELFLAEGRFTLRLEEFGLLLGRLLFFDEINKEAIHWGPGRKDKSLNITLSFDVIDEEAYEIGGKKYREAEQHFEQERKR
jgi:hypothetical protein